MAGRLMKLLFRPGWRLRCVDPPIAWLQLRGEATPTIAIRIQLTCYLTSRYAGPVWLKDAQLRVVSGERVFIVPMSIATDVGGEPFNKEVGFDVYRDEPQHALVEFISDAPDLISLLRKPGPPLAVDVEALLNAAIEFRKVADIDLGHDETLYLDESWRRVSTGRERE